MKNKFNLIALTLIGFIFFTGCSNSATNSITNSKPITNNNSTVTNVTGNTLVNINNAANASNVAIVSNTANIKNSSNSTAAPAGPEVNSGLNVQNFNKLEKGMKYADVAKIFGSEGKIISDGEFGGVRTVMYEWRGSGISFAKVVFQNDKLYDKAHTGLK
jgi:hypothetical protein